MIADTCEALGYTGIFAWLGLQFCIADNEDGTRNCWVKALNADDITDKEAYETYKRTGLPVNELLKHAHVALMPPHSPHRYIVRNRRNEHFTMNPSGRLPGVQMFHMERVPKMITWPEEDGAFI